MKLLIRISILMVGIFASCSKSPKCRGDNKNTGIIENSIRIDCEPASGQGTTPGTANRTFLIKNDSIYEQVFSNQCLLPEIDFSNSSLLGLFTTSQCKSKYIREVVQNEENQAYDYNILVKNCGTCKKSGLSYNWVTVPKIPDGWDVSFNFEIK